MSNYQVWQSLNLSKFHNRDNKHVIRFTVTLLTILLSCSSISATSPTSKAKAPLASELNTISKFDPNLLRTLALSIPLNKNGAIGRNKQGYISVAFQRHSSELIAYGILTRDVQLIETGVKILEYAFAHQKPDGSFLDNSPKQSTGSRASAVAFFYNDLGHSLLLLKDSNWFQRSKETANLRVRLNKLLAPADASLTWLMGQQKALRHYDRNTTNRQFFDVVACYFAGKALNRKDAIKMGEDLAQAALQQQTEQGFFLEEGGYDSSYQAVSLRLALLLYTHLEPDAVSLQQDLWMAIEKGIHWQLDHILPTGEVSTAGNTRVYSGGEKYYGREKKVDFKEVILALNFYSQLSGDRLAQIAADRVLTFYGKRPRHH